MRQVYRHYDPRVEQAPEPYASCPYCRASLIMAERGQKLRPSCPACGFVHFQNPAPTVSILIVDGDRVLLGKRLGHPGQGTWAIPSGYVEYEDDFLSAAVREAREETGLDRETAMKVAAGFGAVWGGRLRPAVPYPVRLSSSVRAAKRKTRLP